MHWFRGSHIRFSRAWTWTNIGLQPPFFLCRHPFFSDLPSLFSGCHHTKLFYWAKLVDSVTRLPDLVIPVNQLSSNSISLIRILFGCYPEKTLPYFFQGGKSTHIFKTKNAAAACAKTPHHWRSSLYMYLLCKKAGKIVKISDERKCHIAFDHMKLTIFYLYKLDKSDKEKGVKTYWNWKIFLSHICYLFVVVYFVCRLKFKAWKHHLYATLLL